MNNSDSISMHSATFISSICCGLNVFAFLEGGFGGGGGGGGGVEGS